MLARKPLMLVAMALANKMARTASAMLIKQENYRVPVMMAAFSSRSVAIHQVPVSGLRYARESNDTPSVNAFC